ncbi:hypothetical protein N7516_004725 [Penicillium verrucosum]|uniref:uncharacterized protein n=1 Tax=Penicillium verrucosum TaxID=60171 RepID=UPI0025459B10|nr:uncharacterized protein N7516_004725 [Penicillium verrucosum]KAJ5944557.1 hypothetical protein N7516_004725 [Penicillium verrucosum]
MHSAYDSSLAPPTPAASSFDTSTSSISSPTALSNVEVSSPPSPRLTKPTLRNMVFSTVIGSGVALTRGAPRRLASGRL